MAKNFLKHIYLIKSSRFQINAFALLLVALLTLSAGLDNVLGQGLPYGTDLNPSLILSSAQAGKTPSHRLDFSITAGGLETYTADLSYPPAFAFMGFAAAGPSGSEVGLLGLDYDADGRIDVSYSLRSSGPSNAYLDVIPDRRYSPAWEPSLRIDAANTISLQLPYGGDANPDTLSAPRAARVSLLLAAGLLRNPAQPGSYSISGRFVSVDPDTDGYNDRSGDAPQTIELSLTVTISESEQIFSGGFETRRVSLP